MAVEKKFADSNIESNYLADSAIAGGCIKIAGVPVSVAAADDDGSIYGIAVVNSASIIRRIDIQTTAITGGTDYDLGFYEYNPVDNSIGAEADKDILMDGQTMASASVALNGLAAVAAGSRSKPVWELAGESSNPNKLYVLALTANTVGTAAGTINVDYTISTIG